MSDDSAVYDEPADWIIDQASQRGAILSRRQLADWHRAGLIAKPHREFFGGPDGSESIYPGGTLRQAIACSVLMKQFGSIERVGWELWMRGFTVAEHYWRGPLREAHEVFRQLAAIAADAENENLEDDGSWQSDAVDRLIETVGNLPRAPGRLGVARRRLRGGRFNELLSIGISAATGVFEVSEGAAGETGDPVRSPLEASGNGTRPAQSSRPAFTVSECHREGSRRKFGNDGSVLAADRQLDVAGYITEVRDRISARRVHFSCAFILVGSAK